MRLKVNHSKYFVIRSLIAYNEISTEIFVWYGQNILCNFHGKVYSYWSYSVVGNHSSRHFYHILKGKLIHDNFWVPQSCV